MCNAIAEALPWHLLVSGAIYPVLSLVVFHPYLALSSAHALVPPASHLDVRFVSTAVNLEVIMEGEDGSGESRTQEVGNGAS
ncbi:hypothetical protein CH231_26265 [Salmonella enterica subsp. enterica serovar Typhimurium]|nr:hypothetical protein CH231_26265 [Salmonella enterica subsp. enterica serovar Typhimurium]